MIRDLKAYEPIEGKFVVKFKKPIQKYANGYTFQLRVGDSSGEVMLKFWGPDNEKTVSDLYSSIKKDDIVFVKGNTSHYAGKVEIDVDQKGILKTLKPEEYDISEFLIPARKDIDEMIKELIDTVHSVQDTHLRKILSDFLNDQDFMEKFKQHPAAMYKHHNWLGGLLEHTLNVVNICNFLAKIHPELNRDLMVTGAMLHDIGKINELEVKTSVKTSIEGILVGHTLMGIEELVYRMEKLKIPKEYKLKLIHMLASHHGKLEYGSPKEPAFPEALAIYLADDIDAKITEMLHRKKTAVTEDDYLYTREFGNIYLK